MQKNSKSHHQVKNEVNQRVYWLNYLDGFVHTSVTTQYYIFAAKLRFLPDRGKYQFVISLTVCQNSNNLMRKKSKSHPQVKTKTMTSLVTYFNFITWLISFK